MIVLSSLARRTMAAGIGLLMAAAAQSQTLYRCTQDGHTRISDKPCAISGDTRLTHFGPAQRSEYSPGPGTRIPPTGKAPDHLGYLSPECAELNDAIRTAPSRGLRSNVIRDLQADYQQRCSQDDSRARKMLSQDRRAESEAQFAQARQQQAEQARARIARDQCDEQLRNLLDRRKRLASMSEGEQADFRRFEASFTQRCRAS